MLVVELVVVFVAFVFVVVVAVISCLFLGVLVLMLVFVDGGGGGGGGSNGGKSFGVGVGCAWDCDGGEGNEEKNSRMCSHSQAPPQMPPTQTKLKNHGVGWSGDFAALPVKINQQRVCCCYEGD